VSSNFLTLCFGIAIFVYGMSSMSKALSSFSGGTLEKILQKSTQNISKSINFGILSTTLIQSSTLISVLTISFLSASLITLSQGIGILFGSQIGTTTGAWLIAGLGVRVSIAKYAMPIIIFGIIFTFQSSYRLKNFGKILLGIGFVFLGVDFIKSGFEATESFSFSQYSVDGIKGVLIYFAIGTIIAIITQSSLATIVLTISALSLGQVAYMNALAIVIGANLGTTLTAIISSLGANTNGKRLAVVYVAFNVFISFLSIIFIKELIFLVDKIALIVRISQENYALKLAVFHTLINVIGVLCLTPFIDKIAMIMEKIIKTRRSLIDEYDDVIYLSDSALQFPNTIKEVLLKEFRHLCTNAYMVAAMNIYIKTDDISDNSNIKEIMNSSKKVIEIDPEELYQKRIKIIYSKMINFIILANEKGFSKSISQNLKNLQRATILVVESLKYLKHIQKNLKKYTVNNNPHISNEYNKIREHILTQLIFLRKIFNIEDKNIILSLINEIEKEYANYSAYIQDTINSLIKNGRISLTMSSSLINDSAYVKNISKNIIEMTKIIYAVEDLAMEDKITDN
jgi:phosphate:Na+ symporter